MEPGLGLEGWVGPGVQCPCSKTRGLEELHTDGPSSLPDVYASSLANPEKREAFPNSSDEKFLKVILMFCWVTCTSLKQEMTLRKWGTLVGLIWPLVLSCDDDHDIAASCFGVCHNGWCVLLGV